MSLDIIVYEGGMCYYLPIGVELMLDDDASWIFQRKRLHYLEDAKDSIADEGRDLITSVFGRFLFTDLVSLDTVAHSPQCRLGISVNGVDERFRPAARQEICAWLVAFFARGKTTVWSCDSQNEAKELAKDCTSTLHHSR